MKRSVLLLAAGLAAAAVIGWAGLNPYLPGGGDNAEYISQAEALVQTGHRANLHLLGDPQDTFRPPLYPYVLATLIRFCGRNVAVFKAVNVLFALGAVAAAWWFLITALSTRSTGPAEPTGTEGAGGDVRGPDEARRSQSPDGEATLLEAGWLSLWFALTPLTVYCAHDVLSDVLFTLLVLLSLGCAARWERPNGMRWVAGSIVLLVVSMFLRTAALFTAGALAGYVLLEVLLRRGQAGSGRRWVTCLAFVVLTFVLLVWSMGGPNTYVESAQLTSGLGAFAGRVGQQGLRYGISLAGEVVSHDTLWPYFPLPPLNASQCHQLKLWAHWPGMLLVGLTACWGCVVLWRRGNRIVPIVWLLHMGALLLWPFFDARFYLPMLPLFLTLVWAGGRNILEGTLRRSLAAGLAATFALLLLPSVCLIGALLSLRDPQPSFMTGLEWSAGGLLLVGTLIWLVSRSDRGSVRRRLIALATVVILSLALVRSLDLNLIRERQWGPILADTGWPEFHAAAMYINERAAPDDAVVSAKTSLVWFWTGLKGVPIPVTTEVSTGRKALARARWAIVDNLPEERVGRRLLLPLLDSDRAHWERLHRIPSLDEEGKTTGETLILRRRDEPKRPPAGP